MKNKKKETDCIEQVSEKKINYPLIQLKNINNKIGKCMCSYCLSPAVCKDSFRSFYFNGCPVHAARALIDSNRAMELMNGEQIKK